MHAFGIEALAVRHAEEPVQHIAAELCRARLSGYAKMVTTTGNFDIEAAFDLPQVFVELAAKIGQAAIVGGLENDIPRYLDCIQDRCFRPLSMVYCRLPRSAHILKCAPAGLCHAALLSDRLPRREFGSASVMTMSTSSVAMSEIAFLISSVM